MKTAQNNIKRLAIIGGGAAGFFAAANLAESLPDLEISIYEASRKFLAKVEISGGGRCNVTHSCFDLAKLSESYPRGRHELRGPFSRFSPSETIEWFEARFVSLKTEDDGRMFPITDSSQTIIDCLQKSVARGNISLNTGVAVRSVTTDIDKFNLELADGEIREVDFVLLASGSSKSGYNIARSLGHNITECAPSLFTFKSKDIRLQDLAGVSFQDAQLTLKSANQKTFRQSGPVLITHWGLSGPAVLKLSAFAARELASSDYQAGLTINWIGNVSEQNARDKLSSLRKPLAKKEIGSNPQFSLTRRFWEKLLTFSEIPLQLHFFELSNQQINKLAEVLTKSEIQIEGKGEFKEEFVTCGGVSLREIDFHRFESKLVPNLFFAGEVLDIDGITGGFNFQAAWTGGWLVAEAIRERV